MPYDKRHRKPNPNQSDNWTVKITNKHVYFGAFYQSLQISAELRSGVKHSSVRSVGAVVETHSLASAGTGRFSDGAKKFPASREIPP